MVKPKKSPKKNLSGSREDGKSGAPRESAVHADCLPATPDNKSAEVRILPAQKIPQLGPGIYDSVSEDVYFGQDSISRSDLVDPSGTSQTPWTPAKFKWFKDNPQTKKKTTKPQAIGRAFHCKLLEASLFKSRYAVSPFDSFRTKASQLWADEQTAACLTILTKDQVDMIDQMEQRARENPLFSHVFRRSGSRKEVTVVAQHPETGLLLRARLDLLVAGNTLVDIKSTLDASPEGFGKQVWNLEYGFQCAFYLRVCNLANVGNEKKEEFVFFAFEKEPPYLSEFYCVPHALIAYCDKILSARLYMIASAMKTNKWKGYTDSNKIEEFELPRYAVSEIQASEER